GVVLAGPRPTGTLAVDTVLIMASVAACVWAAASAPWWALVVLAGASAVLAGSIWSIVAGCLLFAGALAVGARKRSQPVERAVITGGSAVVLASAGNAWNFGVTAAIGVGLMLATAVIGVWRRPGRDRRIAAWAGGVTAAVALVGLIGLSIAGMSAKNELSA